MSDVETIKFQLNQLIPKEAISKRKGGMGMELSYIEGHEVVRQLNRIIGQGNWQYNVKSINFTNEKEITSKDWKTGKEKKGFGCSAMAIVELTAKIGNSSVIFSDVGAGKGIDYSQGLECHEAASKEAVTDAFKRAAKNLGERLGLCLYDKDLRQGLEDGSLVGDDSAVPAPAESPKVAEAEAKLEAEAKQITGSLVELMQLISSTSKVAITKRKLAKADLVKYLQDTYQVNSKEELSESQAQDFLSFLQQHI
jgi:DNA recombination protein Rad52